MRVFLKAPLRTEAEIEPKLHAEPRFLVMPDGKRRMTWMPKVVWEAHAVVTAHGLGPDEIVRMAAIHARESKLPFDLAYPDIIYRLAHILDAP